ncbi:MAG: ester cyclase [Bacteroidetes bacterium]|nr:ester cyclase [Bacteroidota bacterium]
MRTIKIILQKNLTILFVIISCFAFSQTAKITKDVAVKWFALVNKQDTISLTALYSFNAQIVSPNWEGPKTGAAEITHVYARYFSSTPDLAHTITNIIATDTAVIIEYVFSGTLKNPEANTPEYMRGKKYSLSACTIMSVRDGKIIKQQTYFDQVAFLRQVGFFEHTN